MFDAPRVAAGLDDLRDLTFSRGSPIVVYCTQATLDVVSRVFPYLVNTSAVRRLWTLQRGYYSPRLVVDRKGYGERVCGGLGLPHF